MCAVRWRCSVCCEVDCLSLLSLHLNPPAEYFALVVDAIAALLEVNAVL